MYLGIASYVVTDFTCLTKSCDPCRSVYDIRTSLTFMFPCNYFGNQGHPGTIDHNAA